MTPIDTLRQLAERKLQTLESGCGIAIDTAQRFATLNLRLLHETAELYAAAADASLGEGLDRLARRQPAVTAIVGYLGSCSEIAAQAGGEFARLVEADTAATTAKLAALSEPAGPAAPAAAEADGAAHLRQPRATRKAA